MLSRYAHAHAEIANFAGFSPAMIQTRPAPEVAVFWKGRKNYEWRLCTGGKVIAKGRDATFAAAPANGDNQAELLNQALERSFFTVHLPTVPLAVALAAQLRGTLVLLTLGPLSAPLRPDCPHELS